MKSSLSSKPLHNVYKYASNLTYFVDVIVLPVIIPECVKVYIDATLSTYVQNVSVSSVVKDASVWPGVRRSRRVFGAPALRSALFRRRKLTLRNDI
jgi:hypothetical protein